MSMSNYVNRLKELGEKYHDDVIAFSQRLIQTPSISETEKGVADLILAKLKELNFDEVYRDKIGNVIGIVKGTEDGPTIMYNGHMDHVDPGDVENWQGYDPYGGEVDVCEVDNQDKTAKDMVECIHGRAASDVKCGLAAQIYSGGILAQMKKEGFEFKGNYMFAGVVEEESAEAIGMTYLIDNTFPEKGYTYDAMVSCEATSLKIYCGHRGRTEMLATVFGRTSHGSAPWLGINAIYKAMPLINKLKDELYPSLPSDDKLGKSSIALTIIECLPGALSIVPDKCMLSIDRRTIPGENAEIALKQVQDIIDKLEKEDPEFKAKVEVKYGDHVSYTGVENHVAKDMTAWKIAEDNPFVKAATKGLEDVGQEVKYGYWDFATDSSKTAGIDKKPTIGYSPMQEQFAHTPYDKCRIDFIDKAVIGNVSIFLNVVNCDEEAYKALVW